MVSQSPLSRVVPGLPVVRDSGAGRRCPLDVLAPVAQSPFEREGSAERNPALYTHGRGPDYNANVLWWVSRNWGLALELRGIRLDGAGTFRQEFPAAYAHDGPQDEMAFPSTVDVPAAGCWLLRLRTGAVAGVLVVRAVDTP
jgi:hypothetical protein